jgi:pimeloyl-ACP methyl ester carboxylesterase
LKQLLENAEVKGPYVLVGHSLGGLNMQVFADRYPDLVSGLILLDPPPLPFITGQVPDQAALHGILAKINNLGLALISVNQMPAREPSAGEERRVESCYEKPIC